MSAVHIHFLLSCVLGLLAAGAQGASPSSINAQFECTLASRRDTLRVGETPELTIRILSRSDKDVYLVGCLDGSDAGWRYPVCRLDIIDSRDHRINKPVPRCGNMNPLRADDLVPVRPGESFNPCGEGFFAPYHFHWAGIDTPGQYTFRFTYSTESDSLHTYMGDERSSKRGPPGVLIKRFSRVPRMTLTAEVVLTFLGQ